MVTGRTGTSTIVGKCIFDDMQGNFNPVFGFIYDTDMIGMILAVLDDVYIRIAGIECIPWVECLVETIMDRLIFLSVLL